MNQLSVKTRTSVRLLQRGVFLVATTFVVFSANACAEFQGPRTGAGGDRWVPSGALNVKLGRSKSPLVRLRDGRILVPGGAGSQSQAVEAYDPTTWTWMRLTDMARTRAYHTGTLLDDGTVLVVGGAPAFGVPTPELNLADSWAGRPKWSLAASAESELYDPIADEWTRVGMSMSGSRRGHISAKLQTGEVLIAGGRDEGPVALDTAEIYSPATRSWRPAARMTQGRYLASAVPLEDGRIMVIGGAVELGEGPGDDWTAMSGTRTAEVYDPSRNLWAPAASMVKPRWNGTATRLVDGRILVAGMTASSDATISTREGTSEVFDPKSGRWGQLAVMADKVDLAMAATLLGDGRVLVAGGYWIATPGGSPRAHAQAYDVEKSEWQGVAQTRSRHKAPEMLRLDDDSILLVGALSERYFEQEPTPSLTPTEEPDPTVPGTITITPSETAVQPASETPTIAFTVTPSPTQSPQRTPTRIPNQPTPTPTFAEQALGHWKEVARPLFKRYAGDALLMRDGRVLVAGGQRVDETSPSKQRVFSESEIYDPVLDSWSPAGHMKVPRINNQLAYLSTGEIVTFGGSDAVEQFDPQTRSWEILHRIKLPPEQSLSDFLFPTALTSDDKLLITGVREPSPGCDSRAREKTYFLDLHTFQLQSGPLMAVGRSAVLSHLLPDGQLLIAGGMHHRDSDNAGGRCVPDMIAQLHTEIIEPMNNTIRRVGDLTDTRFQPASRLIALPNGHVFVVGKNPLGATNIDSFDPQTGLWSSIPGVRWNGLWASVGVIDNRMFIMVGPYVGFLYDPDAKTWYVSHEMADAHHNAAHVTLADGRFMVISGINGMDTESPLAEVFIIDRPITNKRYIPLLQSTGLRR